MLVCLGRSWHEGLCSIWCPGVFRGRDVSSQLLGRRVPCCSLSRLGWFNSASLSGSFPGGSVCLGRPEPGIQRRSPSCCESGDLLMRFAVSVMARVGVRRLILGGAGSATPRPAGSCLFLGVVITDTRRRSSGRGLCDQRTACVGVSGGGGGRAARPAMQAPVAVAAPRGTSPRPPWRPCRQGALRRRAAPRGGGGRG